MSTVFRVTIILACAAAAQFALAKLPPPSEEANAKAAEAGAKTAWSNKVAAFQLCKVQDRLVASHRASPSATTAAAATPTPTTTATPSAMPVAMPAAMPASSAPCVDPGPYVAASPAAASLEKAGAHSAPASTAPPAATASAPAAKP